jgi:transcriptional regulator with XRE-family HTH domain
MIVKPLRKSKSFQRKFAEFQRNFGAVIRDLRIKASLSRTELARRAKFSVGTLTKIEQGRGNPLLGNMENLATALKLRLSRIFKMAQDRGDRGD